MLGFFSTAKMQLGQRLVSSATEKKHVGSRRRKVQRDRHAVPAAAKELDHQLPLLKRLHIPFLLHLCEPDCFSGVLTQAKEALKAIVFYRSSHKC